MKRIFFLIVFFILLNSCSRVPFYYKLKKIQGTVYDENNQPIKVDFHSRRKLGIQNCENKDLELFLRSLTLGRHGRVELEHLLSTEAKIKIIISDKVGIGLKDGKYRLMAAFTGPENFENLELIANNKITFWDVLFDRDKYVWVYNYNTIEIFKGADLFIRDSTINLTKNNTKIFDLDNSKEILEFNIDTITIEPLLFPDMLYKNEKELYYFVGIHEIYHTRPENIKIQQLDGDAEIDAITLEIKAFKKIKAINRRRIKK